jgi:MarR family transcriptional regulator, temperature-dependent positive regulator of motility
MKNKNNHFTDHFEVLRKIQKVPKNTQRKLAQELGFSLGKLNYCLKALKNKGLVKIHNFRKKDNKIKFLGYVITTKGIIHRTELTIKFMKKKIKEYDELKLELKKIEKMKNEDFDK